MTMTTEPSFADYVPIERLTSGLLIVIPDFGTAEVYGVEFDGEGYAIQYCTDDAAGWDALALHYVKAGECVEHAAPGEPRWLRSRAAVTQSEWEAIAEAEEAKRVHAACFGAVAEAIAVPALMAEVA